MIEIIFRNTDEAESFYSYIKEYSLSPEKKKFPVVLSEERGHIKVKIDKHDQTVLKAAGKALYHFIMKIKVYDWFRKTLKEQYYFSDEEEQRQIIDIIYSILEGKRTDSFPMLKGTDPHRHLAEAINEIFKRPGRFSVESFVKFRLRLFYQQLEKYIKVSIEEYKMEQEYQMFIQALRDFLSSMKTKISYLHLEMKDEIKFYDGRFVEIKRAELTEMIDRRLLYNHPLYVDSGTIAPLLSLAPSVIFYTRMTVNHPLVRTICNIFEERVKIRPLDSFVQKKRLTQKKLDGENIVE